MDHAELDAETRAAADHRGELRLWLRLLTCATLIEGEIRTRLRERFDVTLPRFDLLAQLERAPDGMTLGELSRRMMVSNGNITGLVERLAEQGLLERVPRPRRLRAPDFGRPPGVRRDGARARRLGGRAVRRPGRRRWR
jgi:hypothetical protein